MPHHAAPQYLRLSSVFATHSQFLRSSSHHAPSAPPPPSTLNRRQRDAQARRALLAVFQERWPAAFPRDFRHLKPLAIGIHHDLMVALPRTPGPLIRQTLALWQRWTGWRYWAAVRRGGLMPRFGRELGVGPAAWSPQVEVFERDNQLVVRADLPGLSKDDITVEVRDDALTIEGERRQEHEETRGGYPP